MSKWLHVPFARALQCSFGANCLIALIGGFFSGYIRALLGFYGGRLNPNPFGQTLMLFTLFGSLSALVEAHFWREAMGKPLPKEAAPVDTAERRRIPIEWNSRAVGYQLSEDNTSLWLIRDRYYGYSEGLVLEQGTLKRTMDPKQLGY